MSRFSIFGLPLAILLLWGALFASSLVLPSVNTGIFASPDETAVAVSLAHISNTGSAGVSEPLAVTLPWLHPRSYVASGDRLLPVGFLGWPWWLAQVNRVLPLIPLAWVASLIAASGMIPWYLLLRRRFGATAAWWGTILAWTFPPVLLYLNRSLFSHLPQYTAALWAIWMMLLAARTDLQTRKKLLLQGVAGFLLGVALSFRPIEALWLLPLVGVVVRSFGKIDWRKQGMVLLGCIVGLIPLFVAQAQTYGSAFQIGYWVPSNADPSAVLIPQLVAQAPRPWYYAFAPYGLHPRNVLWNIEAFFLSYLWPWVAVLAASLLTLGFQRRKYIQTLVAQHGAMRQLKKAVFSRKYAILVLGGVIGWLLLMYGSGLYTDHVRVGAVTLGNSFLRYLLPMGFLFAWFMAWVFTHLSEQPRWWRSVYAGFALILVVIGAYTAFARDEEGILATRTELARYAEIRSATVASFQSSDVIISERSDKIFFPLFRAVTPLPNAEQIRLLGSISPSTAIGLFSRPLSLSERDAWRKMGYDVRELQAFGRERLYRLTPFLR